mmetsp:Transcript_16331/g.41802  ORF Transcript_16331/g.41802 Transcript_16331/m.41802 type:complete len:707 (+) Transcript_16331:78-2198(+)
MRVSRSGCSPGVRARGLRRVRREAPGLRGSAAGEVDVDRVALRERLVQRDQLEAARRGGGPEAQPLRGALGVRLQPGAHVVHVGAQREVAALHETRQQQRPVQHRPDRGPLRPRVVEPLHTAGHDKVGGGDVPGRPGARDRQEGAGLRHGQRLAVERQAAPRLRPSGDPHMEGGPRRGGGARAGGDLHADGLLVDHGRTRPPRDPARLPQREAARRPAHLAGHVLQHPQRRRHARHALPRRALEVDAVGQLGEALDAGAVAAPEAALRLAPALGKVGAAPAGARAQRRHVRHAARLPRQLRPEEPVDHQALVRVRQARARLPRKQLPQQLEGVVRGAALLRVEARRVERLAAGGVELRLQRGAQLRGEQPVLVHVVAAGGVAVPLRQQARKALRDGQQRGVALQRIAARAADDLRDVGVGVQPRQRVVPPGQRVHEGLLVEAARQRGMPALPRHGRQVVQHLRHAAKLHGQHGLPGRPAARRDDALDAAREVVRQADGGAQRTASAQPGGAVQQARQDLVDSVVGRPDRSLTCLQPIKVVGREGGEVAGTDGILTGSELVHHRHGARRGPFFGGVCARGRGERQCGEVVSDEVAAQQAVGRLPARVRRRGPGVQARRRTEAVQEAIDVEGAQVGGVQGRRVGLTAAWEQTDVGERQLDRVRARRRAGRVQFARRNLRGSACNQHNKQQQQPEPRGSGRHGKACVLW